MRNIIILFLLTITALLLNSCSGVNRPAIGPEDEIIVVADSVEYEQLKPVLDSTFEKIIYTPQPEKLFTLKRVSVNQIENYEHRKNIIITAPLNSNSAASKYINSVVDSTIRSKINSGDDLSIKKYGLWAKGQLVVVLTAANMQKLKENIKKDSGNLLYAFQKASDKRLYEGLYDPTYEREDIEGKLLKEYGWIIYVQADYQVAIDKPDDNFVWLRRSPGTEMERWIFVHWIDNASPAYLNEDSIRVIRNRMTKKYYRTSDDSAYVIIAKDYYTTNEVNFKGKYAIFTQGLWELNIKGMGGPFINYTFFDEKSKRLYMLDASIYAPRYYKRTLIQQMDVTLQSFMTADELSKDRREDLLSAAKKANKN